MRAILKIGFGSIKSRFLTNHLLDWLLTQNLKERLTPLARRFDSILPSFSRDLFLNLHTEDVNKIVQCPLFKCLTNHLKYSILLYEIPLYTEW